MDIKLFSITLVSSCSILILNDHKNMENQKFRGQNTRTAYSTEW